MNSVIATRHIWNIRGFLQINLTNLTNIYFRSLDENSIVFVPADLSILK
jgi:hypothetical protein